MTYGLVGFFAYMETVLGPIMPFLRKELGLGYTAASLHFSAFALGAVLLGFIGDRIVGRWGRHAALWGGAFGVAAGALFLISSPSAWGTVPAAFAMGICGAQVLVTSQAVLSDRHGEWSAVALTESNVTASGCAIVASEWCIGYWGADFLADETGLTRPAAATSLTAFFAAMLVGRVASSRLARTLPPAVLLAVTLFVALLGFPLFWLSPGTPLALAGLFVTGLGIGGVYPLGVSAAIASAPGNTDAAAARLSVGGGGAILVAPFVLGTLADRVGIGTAFGIVVPMLVAALVLALIAGRRGSQASV